MCWISFLLLTLLLSTVASGQSALSLYAIDGNFPADSDQTSQLYRIDSTSGEVLDVVGDNV